MAKSFSKPPKDTDSKKVAKSFSKPAKNTSNNVDKSPSKSFSTITKNPWFFPIVATTIYFLLNLILVFLHEPWGDEANPWLIAREMNFDNVWNVMSVEPHPLLWFLILAPFAKLGFPYITLNFISLGIMSLAVLLLTRYAPFSRWVKIAIISGVGFFYFNPVISRNYCLVALALVVVACVYRERLKRPLVYALSLVLLCQSHFLVLPFAAALSFVFGWEYLHKWGFKRIRPLIASGAFVLSSVLLSLPMIFGTLASHTQIIKPDTPPADVDLLLETNFGLFGTPIPVFEITICLLMIYLYFRYPKLLGFLCAGIIPWYFTFSSVYYLAEISTQQYSIIILYIMFTLWVKHYESPRKISKTYRKIRQIELVKALRRIPIPTSIAVLSIASLPMTIDSALFDAKDKYSNSQEVASYINSFLPAKSVILVANSNTASTAISFMPYLTDERSVYDVRDLKNLTFYKYQTHSNTEATQLEDTAKTLADDGYQTYYLSYQNTCDQDLPALPQWQHIHSFTVNARELGINLDLYQIN